MSGSTDRDDELEFTEDFVLDDSPSELDRLFDDEAPPAASPRPALGGQPADADDLLFGDTSEARAAAAFEEPTQFRESGGLNWKGFRLSADEIGIPVQAGGEGAEAAADPLAASLLEGAEDFALEETELELVDSDRDLGLGEAELEVGVADGGADTPETFVLDDGESTWQTHVAEAAMDTGSAPAPAFAEESTWLAEQDAPQTQPDFEAVADAEPAEEDWAPLAADGLEHSGELEPVGAGLEDPAQAESWQDEARAEEFDELVGAGVAAEAYEEEPVGAPPQQGRWRGWFAGLAAAVLLLGAGGIVVLRPAWLGLSFAPELVERVAVQRPKVTLPVPPPVVDPVAQTDPVPPPVVDPVAQTDPVPPPVVDPVTQTDPVPPPVVDPVAQTDPIDPANSMVTIPVPVAGTQTLVRPGNAEADLLPAGDSLLIGSFQPLSAQVANAAPLPGVMPGSRAFVQLHNGNFFIGSVKSMGVGALTMRVDNGEVSLPVDQVVRVTALGSEEYAELQKATSGFIRLTNNNRLVGSILESIADDHVILEMRSDRVVVPRSAIEEIGSTRSGEVRFAPGGEEEQWLQKLAERRQRELTGGTASPTPPKDPPAPR